MPGVMEEKGRQEEKRNKMGRERCGVGSGQHRWGGLKVWRKPAWSMRYARPHSRRACVGDIGGYGGRAQSLGSNSVPLVGSPLSASVSPFLKEMIQVKCGRRHSTQSRHHFHVSIIFTCTGDNSCLPVKPRPPAES